MTSEGAGPRLVDFLDHIAEAARLAREYVRGMSQESFLQDRRTQQAVVLNLMTIGEVAARIANEHKDFALRALVRSFQGAGAADQSLAPR